MDFPYTSSKPSTGSHSKVKPIISDKHRVARVAMDFDKNVVNPESTNYKPTAA